MKKLRKVAVMTPQQKQEKRRAEIKLLSEQTERAGSEQAGSEQAGSVQDKEENSENV